MIYKDQLEAVYKLLEDPKRWTQGTWARDSNDNPEVIMAACKWCLLGAAVRVGACKKWDAADEMTSVLSLDAGDFNDDHTHPEVLALLRSAINRAPVR